VRINGGIAAAITDTAMVNRKPAGIAQNLVLRHYFAANKVDRIFSRAGAEHRRTFTDAVDQRRRRYLSIDPVLCRLTRHGGLTFSASLRRRHCG
jgi:hypothetical protein